MNRSTRTRRTSFTFGLLLTYTLAVGRQANTEEPQVEPQGAEKSTKTELLEMEAKVKVFKTWGSGRLPQGFLLLPSCVF
jgi:hypothetical protein